MHVLVHYLFTNSYQCLQPQGTTKHEKIAAEFLTATHTYAGSRKYEISSLEELARAEMQKLSKKLHFSIVISLLQGAYPFADAEDTWFSSLLKRRLISFLLNPSESECEISGTERTTLSLSNLLLNCLRELAEDQLLHVHNPDAISKAGVTDSFIFKMPIPQQGLRESLTEPCSDTEISRRLELTEPRPPEYGSEHGYDSLTSEPGAELACEEEPACEAQAPEWGCEPAEPLAMLAYAEELVKEDTFAEGIGPVSTTSQMKKKKKGKKMAVEESRLDLVEAKQPDDAPAAVDEWSLCGSEGKATRMNCELRAEHVLHEGWKVCGSCRLFVAQLQQ